MKKGLLQNLGPWEKLLLFITVCIFSSMLFSLMGMTLVKPLFGIDPYDQSELLDLGRLESIRSIKLINLFFQIGGFLIPSILFARLLSTEPNKYLTIQQTPKLGHFGILILFFLALTIINGWLTEINSHLDMSFISEELQEKIEYDQAMINKSIYAYIGLSWRSYFLNLILLAIVPAISEEFLFRGVFQRLMVKASGKLHLGIWATAFIFAFIHFQFLDFLPRLVLGLVFGYVVIITGNLWHSITLHFLNNGFALTLEFLSRKGLIDLSNSWLSISVIHLIFAFTTVAFVIYFYTKRWSWNEMRTAYRS